jgi:hypothetical protein
MREDNLLTSIQILGVYRNTYYDAPAVITAHDDWLIASHRCLSYDRDEKLGKTERKWVTFS